MPAAFFVYASIALAMAVNAIRGPSPPTSRFPALWLPAVLMAEVPWMWLLLRVLIAALLIAAGALDMTIGRIALVLLITAQSLQVVLIVRASRSARRIAGDRSAAAWWERLTGWPYRIPPEISRIDDIEYAPGLTLDLYRPHEPPPGPAPCLVYAHGGSWGGGDPRRVFRPVVHYLASRGWVVLTIRYPLSPLATFPEHLIGVKRALQWAKTAGVTQFGVDAERIAVAGGSAGAHLAALAALTTSTDQLGFAQFDTSVKAAVVLYGIYDFVNRNGARYDWPLIPERVMKVAVSAAPDAYRAASPIDQVRSDAPPFLVVHGTSDSLVPIAEARHFVEALGAVEAPVDFLKVEFAQHAFDILNGVRTRALAVRIERFLNVMVGVAPLDAEPVDGA
ncbi:MAG: alpha/beta hydrolase fold domain-containing protein [Acidimicrobiia bacterium]